MHSLSVFQCWFGIPQVNFTVWVPCFRWRHLQDITSYIHGFIWCVTHFYAILMPGDFGDKCCFKDFTCTVMGNKVKPQFLKFWLTAHAIFLSRVFPNAMWMLWSPQLLPNKHRFKEKTQQVQPAKSRFNNRASIKLHCLHPLTFPGLQKNVNKFPWSSEHTIMMLFLQAHSQKQAADWHQICPDACRLLLPWPLFLFV